MENHAKNIVRFASDGNASKVKESIYSLLKNKVGIALSARKSALAQNAFGTNSGKKD